MTKKVSKEQSLYMYELVGNIRGKFINDMCVFETLLDTVIAKHFCKRERKEEFIFAIASQERFTLSFKIGLIGFITKNHFPDVLKENETLLGDMDDLRDFRNILAHRVYDPTDEEMLQQSQTDILLLTIKTTHKNKIKDRRYELTDVVIKSHNTKLKNALISLGKLDYIMRKKQRRKSK